MKRCPSCGATFEIGAGFCPNDGAALVDDAPSPAQSGRMVGGAAAAWHPAPQSAQKTADALDSNPRGRDFDADGEEILLGRTLNERYRIEDRIGAGGMGLVYRATQLNIDKPVALKVLRAEYSEVEDVAKRFEMEARVASKINHPNVVGITDYGHTPYGSPYYVMELLEGPSLADIIDGGGPIAIDRALRIAAQLAAGLVPAHELGVVHRDLKPDNVVMVAGADGEVAKILDFGIARVKSRNTRLTAAGSVVGTPEYMAPEQAQGKEVDLRADIYSVGVILFEMLCGKVPIRGTTMVETLTKQVYDPAPSLASMDPRFASAEYDALVQLVDRTLSKDPGQRPSSGAELAASLKALLEPAPVSSEKSEGFKATVAMGSWSVGDLPGSGPASLPMPQRPGPQLSQGAPEAVEWSPTPQPTPAAAAISTPAPAAAPMPAAASAGMPAVAPAPAPAAQVPPQAQMPQAQMPMQVPPGYTRRPTGSMRRHERTQWGVMLVVGVLGSFGAALGVVALFQVFGSGQATETPAAVAPQPMLVEQAKADTTPPAEQSAASPVETPADDPPESQPEDPVAEGGEVSADDAGGADAPPEGAKAEPGAPNKKKSTKKAKKAKKKLDGLPKPDSSPSAGDGGHAPDPKPSKPADPKPGTDPPPDPGVSLGDLRDPFG